ncbi:Hypothetical predicted protein [Podarcis lilfordi]|uniref:Uncharacterized protein n=1 Tax=Podarcis lilfordi TaxID=74358 RepID=A0AA35KBY5_9SAUR|nr:Hypothetical predicted protein [Podarcis lilfordi]
MQECGEIAHALPPPQESKEIVIDLEYTHGLLKVHVVQQLTMVSFVQQQNDTVLEITCLTDVKLLVMALRKMTRLNILWKVDVAANILHQATEKLKDSALNCLQPLKNGYDVSVQKMEERWRK